MCETQTSFMKSGLRKNMATLALSVLTATSASAATVITVVNSSFESPDVGTGFSATVTGWTTDGVRSLTQGMLSGDIPATDGDQILILDARQSGSSGLAGWAFQEVSTISVGDTYTLDLSVIGRSAVGRPANYEYGLYAGATGAANFTDLIGVATQDQTDDSLSGESIETEQIVWNSTGHTGGTELYVGMRVLSLHSGGSTTQVGFDGISLTAVPEPSSTTLLGLAGLALILRRRK